MGIYGAAHTYFEEMAYEAENVPCMANQLKRRYGDSIFSEDLSWLKKAIDPTRIDIIEVGGKDYEASYFGKEGLSGFRDFEYREFWRLENAYEDFKNNKKTGDVLPYDNYPFLIDTKQVFIVEYMKTDGSLERMYFRSDGKVWEGLDSTEEFKVK